MDYEVEFELSALYDCRDIAFHETIYTLSIEKSRSDVKLMVDQVIENLHLMPCRFPEKKYGFTDTLRRKYDTGKYCAFFWVDEETATVHVERILHSKADFGRIHFGN